MKNKIMKKKFKRNMALKKKTIKILKRKEHDSKKLKSKETKNFIKNPNNRCHSPTLMDSEEYIKNYYKNSNKKSKICEKKKIKEIKKMKKEEISPINESSEEEMEINEEVFNTFEKEFNKNTDMMIFDENFNIYDETKIINIRESPPYESERDDNNINEPEKLEIQKGQINILVNKNEGDKNISIDKEIKNKSITYKSTKVESKEVFNQKI